MQKIENHVLKLEKNLGAQNALPQPLVIHSLLQEVKHILP